mmetsp:Transcript_17313/g.25961  ORF Transcript_17313/g.25961 Transcript_17313/m.25961 type:complete len:1013 (-) Transcript_17313:81-3119(-)
MLVENRRHQRSTSRPAVVRLDEQEVISMCFLRGKSKPSLAVLYSDTQQQVFLKTYTVNTREMTLERGPWRDVVPVEGGAKKLIPIPGPFGGVLVIGQQSVAYIDSKRRIDQRMDCGRIECWGHVDRERYLLGDIEGKLLMVMLRHDGKEVKGIQIESNLGITTRASTLTYLDNAHVFVGSCSGDSQLIKLTSTPTDNGYIQEIDRFCNLGPILDFCMVDLDRQGQGMMVTCSGAGKDGSLRAIRNGIGINPDATIDMEGMQGIWSLKSELRSPYHQYLVISFAVQTFVLSATEMKKMDVEADDEKGDKPTTQLTQVEVSGFDHQNVTLFASNLLDEYLVQITPYEARIISCLDLRLKSKWTPSSKSSRIHKAFASGPYVLLATNRNQIVLLQMDTNAKQLRETNHTVLPTEVSCLTLASFDDNKPSTNSSMEVEIEKKTSEKPLMMAAVGLWDDEGIVVLQIPSLKVMRKEKLETDSIARSVAFCKLDSTLRLFCGMGDGRLFTFEVRNDAQNGVLFLSSPQKVALGTEPIALTCFENKSGWHLMACCDRPTVVYCANNSPRLLYNNVNLKHVRHMVTFRTKAAPDALVFATRETLILGTPDTMQKLHISTIPMGEQPRRIAHLPEKKCFLVCCEAVKEGDLNHLRLADGQTFDFVDKIALEENELAVSVTSTTFKGDPNPYFCVGTAFVLPHEDEPSRGRILIIRVNADTQTLHIVGKAETKGTVYCLEGFNGRLLAGVNSVVQLYEWIPLAKGKGESKDRKHGVSSMSIEGWNLTKMCSHRGHIVALCIATHGEFFVVGDLMKSVVLLMYKEDTKTLVELARDWTNNWMTAVTMIDDQVYLGTEDKFHLFALKRNQESIDDEERRVLETVGKYHLGEFVNRFQKGSLVMQTPEMKQAGGGIHTYLYGTVNGAIGVVASLSKRQYQFFKKLEIAIEKVVRGIGGMSHKQFRSYLELGNGAPGYKESKNFVDGDLVEKFLSLHPSDMQRVAQTMQLPVDRILMQVELGARIH